MFKNQLNGWIGISNVFSQVIRWKRKPMWLPTAKSKLFRVPPRVKLPQHEAVEILRLHNNYRTYRKSIREYLIEIVRANQVQFDEELLKKAEEQDYISCYNINDEWNRNIAEIRKVRLEKQYEQHKEHVLQNIEKKEQKINEIMIEIEEKVRRTKIDAKSFITRDNIDQAIEEALTNIVNYNEAIDHHGNYYKETKSIKEESITGATAQ